MVKSPRKLRSGKRLTDNAAESKNTERSLSVDSDPASNNPEMDSAEQTWLSQLLTKDDFLQKITTKLAGKLQTIVQRAVATSNMGPTYKTFLNN